MDRTSARLAASLFTLLLYLSTFTPARADQWTQPTTEELRMTSQPEVPGAAAVYLYREERTEDKYHVFDVYIRLKVLTEGGKQYGDVELTFASFQNRNSYDFRGYTVGDIAGRTIHADGTIIPFTGKPYEKLIEKTEGSRVMAEVFSMPDVQVGSIIEYRYSLHIDEDRQLIAPQWYIQSNLYTRKAHYVWKPTSDTLITNDDRGQLSNTIAWTPILPTGTTLQQIRQPKVGTTGEEEQLIFEVNAHDIPPIPNEELMPPIGSFSYRVLFYYSHYWTPADYWQSEGKHWSKLQDKFIGPGPGVNTAVQQLTAPSDTQDKKLRKLYDAVMQIENTNFTRARSQSEEKALGLDKPQSTDDILARKRGSSNQLAELFVAMARAAGMKAHIMAVTSRDRHLFNRNYLSLSQLDDFVAIVNVDGKEQFFDPGARYCPYQHLAWKHTGTEGVRQTDGGGEFARTPGEPYTFSRVQRVANLTMDQQGIVTGTVKITFTGSPALNWRQRSLTGDATGLDHDLRESVEKLVPQGMDVKVRTIEKLPDYESPLTVNFDVEGPLASSTGKRLLLSGDIFEANSRSIFPQEKRETAVYFEYAHLTQDAVRVNFPATLAVESLPAGTQYQLLKSAMYALKTESTPTSITFRREFLLGDIIFMADEYPALRTFYGQFENKDQEPVVLHAASATSDKPGSLGN
jgi:transglutaminase superfamily protein